MPAFTYLAKLLITTNPRQAQRERDGHKQNSKNGRQLSPDPNPPVSITASIASAGFHVGQAGGAHWGVNDFGGDGTEIAPLPVPVSLSLPTLED